MASYNHPGVYVNELALAATPVDVTGSANAAGAIVAQFEQGPSVVTRVSSWYEFQSKFGTYNAKYPATYSVWHFFQNGGDTLYVRRVLSPDAVFAEVTLYDTAGTPVPVATFKAKYKGDDGNRLRVQVNNKITVSGYDYYDITVTYDSGAANSLNADVSTGSGATLQVTSGTADDITLEKFNAVSFNQPDSSDYFVNVLAYGSNYITAVSLATPTAVLSSYVLPLSGTATTTTTITGSTGTGTVITHTTSSTANIAIGNTVVIAGSSVTGYNGTYVVTGVTLNTSFTVAGTTTASGTGGTAKITFGKAEYTGDTASAGTLASFTILREFDVVDRPLVLWLPDVISKLNNSAWSNTVLNAAITWAESGSGYVVLDTAPDLAPAAAVSAAAGYSVSSRAAVYYPHVFIKDVNGNSGAALRKIGPAGAMAGLFLATDRASGPWKTPAGLGTKVQGALALERAFTSTELDTLHTAATPVNAIRQLPGAGVVVMGGRTLKQDNTANRYVAMRRSLIYINKSLSDLSQFALFESNTEELWARLTTTLGNFLNTYRNQGGLRGTTPAEAYYVKCDAENNSNASIAQGYVNIEVGVSLEYPAEYVVINLSQLTGQ
jgi:phage tail sheath protein FI